MKRKLYDKLLEWKNSKNRKPLILNGARQVGKTWLLKEFGKNEYERYVYINCDQNEEVKKIFSQGLNTQRIIRDLSALTNTKIDSDTLLILDEIQEIPEAITSLKYFCENERDIHIAAAGSLLGLMIHKGTGFPVGKIDMLNLYPLSFMEFLEALGRDEISNVIKTHDWEGVNNLNHTLDDILRQYYYVGGMPEVVNSYIATNDVLVVRKIQNNILKNYSFDFSKHIPSAQVAKTQIVWQSIPGQLAKENKKFVYTAIRKGSRAAEFENSIRWLKDAGLIHLVSRIKKIEKPIKFYEDFNAFKIYLNDIGLLGAMAGASSKDLLVSDNAFTMFKGSLTEQFILQQYISTIPESPIFYYTNENSTLEIDFVIEADNVFPVEVKAETNLRSKSLSTVLKSNPSLHGLRFSASPYKVQQNITNIPLYLAEEYFGQLYDSKE